MVVRKLIVLGVLIFTVLLSPLFSLANEDGGSEDSLHQIWDELLHQYVKDGRVDYYGLQQEEERLQEYLDDLNGVDFTKMSRAGQLALYINGYNACTVKLILNEAEGEVFVDTIKDIGGFFSSPWDISFCRIGGEVLSLNTIEHDIIRPKFKDNRIHFAVNCASKSCPQLYENAFFPSLLDGQLEEVTSLFLKDKKSNYIKGTTLYLSKIFKWYGDDFGDDLLIYYEKYNEVDVKKSSVKVKYLPYDWSLNIVQ